MPNSRPSAVVQPSPRLPLRPNGLRVRPWMRLLPSGTLKSFESFLFRPSRFIAQSSPRTLSKRPSRIGKRKMLIQPLSKLIKMQEDSLAEFVRLRNLRTFRRADSTFKGCDFCFDTCWGELEDGTVVPCADHNGLCL